MARLLTLAIALSLASPSGHGPKDATPAADGGTTVTCTFSNPSYSGYCKQTQQVPDGATAQGVCRSILECLNNTQCSQTYCNATQIRGGWKLESVEATQGNP